MSGCRLTIKPMPSDALTFTVSNLLETTVYYKDTKNTILTFKECGVVTLSILHNNVLIWKGYVPLSKTTDISVDPHKKSVLYESNFLVNILDKTDMENPSSIFWIVSISIGIIILLFVLSKIKRR